MMRYFVPFSQWLVGLVFILSGLIKLNDPLGFSFKLDEYFSASVFNMPYLFPFSLSIALILVVTEVLLGVMLLIGFRIKLTLRLLLAMLIFFGFLTFYSAYYNKVTDCGCFGDAIKFTPWQSFVKDLVLLFFVLIISVYRCRIRPLFSATKSIVVIILNISTCIVLATYVLLHLPIIDFRPYKVGVNISQAMTIPKESPEDTYEYKWVFRENGKTKLIKNKGEYPETTGDYIEVSTKLIQKGYEPPIHDFSMKNGDDDYTTELLGEEMLLIFAIYDITTASSDGLSQLRKIANQAREIGYRVVILSASSPRQNQSLVATYDLDITFYSTDRTTLKTIIRSNPGIIRLHQGTIIQKLHHNDFDELKWD